MQGKTEKPTNEFLCMIPTGPEWWDAYLTEYVGPIKTYTPSHEEEQNISHLLGKKTRALSAEDYARRSLYSLAGTLLVSLFLAYEIKNGAPIFSPVTALGGLADCYLLGKSINKHWKCTDALYAAVKKGEIQSVRPNIMAIAFRSMWRLLLGREKRTIVGMAFCAGGRRLLKRCELKGELSSANYISSRIVSIGNKIRSSFRKTNNETLRKPIYLSKRGKPAKDFNTATRPKTTPECEAGFMTMACGGD
jgi:hypothetical protein